MADIEILSNEETAAGYQFDVAVDHAGQRTTHTVTMSHAGRGPLMDRFDVREAMQLYPAFEAEAHRALE